MIIIFDLDDTLYEEISYLTSGFKVLLAILKKILAIVVSSYQDLCILQEFGRGTVFDKWLLQKGIFSKSM